MLKAAILASGNGTNAQRFFDMAAEGTLDIDIRLVLCNRPGAGVLERAKKAGVPSLCLDHKTFPSREAFDQAMIRAIREAGADTIVLAGYMRLLTNAFLQAFPGRIINIHPALLPSFPGLDGVGDAAAYGVKITGCTVHFVDEIMDHGEVIIQAAMPHAAGEPVEDLRMRIHAAEHRIYPQALQWLSEGRISRKGREVFLAPGNKPLAPQPEGMLIWPPLEEGF
ncbi:MAG: phosphoribosylglycinamide formyltransferase [Desulfovibrionaceae bacterium]|nr:phosphoribosylglycinamide formyltransferase [Desulfovibrionaceae bacterium]